MVFSGMLMALNKSQASTSSVNLPLLKDNITVPIESIFKTDTANNNTEYIMKHHLLKPIIQTTYPLGVNYLGSGYYDKKYIVITFNDGTKFYMNGFFNQSDPTNVGNIIDGDLTTFGEWNFGKQIYLVIVFPELTYVKEVKIKNNAYISYPYRGNLLVKWETDLDGEISERSETYTNNAWAARWRNGGHVYSDETRSSEITPAGNMLYSPLINQSVKTILICGNNLNTTNAFRLNEIIINPGP